MPQRILNHKIDETKDIACFPHIHFKGIFAWFIWMFVHLMSLAGFRNKAVTFVNWIWSYFSYDRGTRLIIRPFSRELMTEDTTQK